MIWNDFMASSEGAMNKSAKNVYPFPKVGGFSKAPSDSRGTDSGPPMPR